MGSPSTTTKLKAQILSKNCWSNLSLNWQIVIVVTLGLASVFPTGLWGIFIFDDTEGILNNKDVTGIDPWEQESLGRVRAFLAGGQGHVPEDPLTQTIPKSSIWDIFVHDFWGVPISHPASHKSYRPLTTLVFRLEYFLWGQNPLFFHLLSWVVHGLNCGLVLLFLRKCLFCVSLDPYCRKIENGGQGQIRGNKKTFDSQSQLLNAQMEAFLGALIFSVHPIHVEPLGGIVGQADLLTSTIFLAGFILLPELGHHDGSFGVGGTRGIWIVMIGILSSLFKETGITFILFRVALDIFQIKRLNGSLVNKRDLITYVTTVLFLSVTFISWRLWFQGGPPVFQHFDNPPVFAGTYFSKVASIVYIWWMNVFLLICPTWLCYDWSMGCIPLIESALDLRFWISLIFSTIALKLAVIAIRRSSRSFVLSITLAASTFLPSTNIFFTVGFVLAERNLYLPSIGFSIFMAHAFFRVPKGHWVIFGVLGLFFARSLQRSGEWTSQEELFLSGLKVCPGNAKVHYNLGTMYGQLGNISLAISSYEIAILLKPDYYQAMNNLGNIYRSVSELEKAETWLRRAVALKEDMAAAWMNLGIVLSKKNSTEAMNCYRRALKYRNQYPDCEYNIGNLFLESGDTLSAIHSWKRVIASSPTHSHAWINIVILLQKDGKVKEALEWAKIASTFLPSDSTLQFLMGNLYGTLKIYDQAETYFKRAISLSSDSGSSVPAKYWANLGVLYHRWGAVGNAKECYDLALQINPTLESTKKNLKLLEKLKQ